jgi:crotonobetainyl-CoA:carnitine CoA-transferase CaiB-like acyl-CoA transferase
MKLEGVRVLDLSSFIPGPYLALALADHGAEVIKIERPGTGDPTRGIGLSDGPDTVLFRNFNRGKRSIVLDLKRDADREIFLRLADEADVIVESNRPGVARRLGVDYPAVSRRNPGIVYCSITAFGQGGPKSGRPAHDLALQAETGILSTNLGRDGNPAMPALAVTDYLSALQGLSGVLMALLARERTGRGDYIDIAMAEAAMAATLNVLGPTIAEGRQPVPQEERSTGGAAFYDIYDLADGRQIVLAGSETKFVHALLAELGRPELAPLCDHPGPHQEPVRALLRQTFKAMTREQASVLLDRLDICWGAVNSFPEALADEHMRSRNFITTDDLGRPHVGSPIRFRHQPAKPNLQAPSLGQDQALIADRSRFAG